MNPVTFNGNSARDGGAIYNNAFPHPLTLRTELNHVTFVDNHRAVQGGALYSNEESGSATVEHL